MDYTLELQNIKNWIKNLIIVQYRQSPKNRALIDLLCDVTFANNLILKIRDLCLNVEKSEGAQLDVVGKWVGIDRFYNAIDLWTHPYLALVTYEDITAGTFDQYQGGFSTYENFETHEGGFLTYEAWQDVRTKVNAMGDEYFRHLIKLKIIHNSINHTCKNIDDSIWKWSNGMVYTTWNTMEVTYHYDKTYKNVMMLAMYKGILPYPTGCTIVLEEII